MDILNSKDCFILDMDGTFYLGEDLIEGSLEFIEELRRLGKKFVFFTNNSSKTAESYVEKLGRMGCRVNEDSVITSGEVTASFLEQHHPGASVFLLGTPDLEAYMQERGIRLTGTDPDIVLAAFDTTLTYEKLSAACSFIRKGSLFLATHPDLNCPTEDGFIPDCGSICACITASTGAVPKYLGKPHAETVSYLEKMLGVPRDKMVLAGDRLYTEIAMGQNHGITTVLVLSGETGEKDLESSSVRPDIVVPRLINLLG